MNRLFACTLFGSCLCLAASARDNELPKIEPPPYHATFANNAYSSAEAFKNELKEFKSPWRELFEGARESEDGGYVIAPYDKLQSVETIHKSDQAVLVSAVAERFRVSFCAVVFLLTKNGKDLRVADIIRRTDIGYSSVNKMEIVPLKPEKYIHLHISTYCGGRRWGWDSDELFIVKDERFKPTLALRDGFGMTPANPYNSFVQGAEIQAHEGMLCMHMTRIWVLEKGERQQKFDVDFHWNPRAEKWESPDVGKIILDEPKLWSGQKLPKPPEVKTRKPAEHDR